MIKTCNCATTKHVLVAVTRIEPAVGDGQFFLYL